MLKLSFPIFGAKVSLQSFLLTDITEAYISWLNNKVLLKYSNQRFVNHNYSSCLKYYRSFKKTDNLFLIIKRITDGCAIGTLTVYFSKYHGVADVGILIGDEQSVGTGLGSDAWCALIDALSTQDSVRKITAGTLRSNKAMARLMAKSGMLHECTKFKQELCNGMPEDILYYAKFNNT